MLRPHAQHSMAACSVTSQHAPFSSFAVSHVTDTEAVRGANLVRFQQETTATAALVCYSTLSPGGDNEMSSSHMVYACIHSMHATHSACAVTAVCSQLPSNVLDHQGAGGSKSSCMSSAALLASRPSWQHHLQCHIKCSKRTQSSNRPQALSSITFRVCSHPVITSSASNPASNTCLRRMLAAMLPIAQPSRSQSQQPCTTRKFHTNGRQT